VGIVSIEIGAVGIVSIEIGAVGIVSIPNTSLKNRLRR